jgi:hypothetical protein
MLNRQCICKYNVNSLCQGLGVKDQSKTSRKHEGVIRKERWPLSWTVAVRNTVDPLGHTICGCKSISPEKEMALSYWACGDWTCENKHLNSINLFNLHSKVEISAIKCSQVRSSP